MQEAQHEKMMDICTDALLFSHLEIYLRVADHGLRYLLLLSWATQILLQVVYMMFAIVVVIFDHLFRFVSSWRRPMTGMIPITREVFVCLTALRCIFAQSLDLRLVSSFPESETNRFSSLALRKSSAFDNSLSMRLPCKGARRDWRVNDRLSRPTDGAMSSAS